MSENIHATAIIEEGAQLGKNTSIGAYAYIGKDVSLGENSIVHHHAIVDGNTTTGSDNEFHPYSYIGGKTQDTKFTGGNPGLIIGDKNIFREFSTVHCATNDKEVTTIGSENLFLSYTHIAHDCIVGNHIIMSNNATLAGHVEVEDHVSIGGFTAIHQFCRLGYFSFLGGCAKVVQDIPPYMIGDGNPAEVKSINKVGMQRNNFTEDDINNARKIFKILYREGYNRTQALEKLNESDLANFKVAKQVIDFINRSDRGLA